MTITLKQVIDVSVTRWYHCMTRCVIGASMLSNGLSDRKEFRQPVEISTTAIGQDRRVGRNRVNWQINCLFSFGFRLLDIGMPSE
jgi:hypothetical protein